MKVEAGSQIFPTRGTINNMACVVAKAAAEAASKKLLQFQFKDRKHFNQKIHRHSAQRGCIRSDRVRKANIQVVSCVFLFPAAAASAILKYTRLKLIIGTFVSILNLKLWWLW